MVIKEEKVTNVEIDNIRWCLWKVVKVSNKGFYILVDGEEIFMEW